MELVPVCWSVVHHIDNLFHVLLRRLVLFSWHELENNFSVDIHCSLRYVAVRLLVQTNP